MKKDKNFKSWLKDEIVSLDFGCLLIFTFVIFMVFFIVIFMLARWILSVELPTNILTDFCITFLTVLVASFLYVCFEDDRSDTRLKMRVLEKEKSLEELNDLECDLYDRKQELLSRLKQEPVDSMFFKDIEVRLAKIQEYIERTQHEIEVTTKKVNETTSRYV